MIYYQDRLIDLLDHKYELAAKLSGSDFLLEVGSFIDFVLSQEIIEPYARQLASEFQCRESDYRDVTAQTKDGLVQLRRRLVEMFPDSDDSQTPFPAGDNLTGPAVGKYEWTLAHFDYIVEHDCSPISHLGADDVYALPKTLKMLINILDHKIESLEQSDDCSELRSTLYELDREFAPRHLEHTNYCRVSPGYAFDSLSHAVDLFRDNPTPYPSLSYLLTDYVIGSFLSNDHSHLKQEAKEVEHDIRWRGTVDERLVERLRVLLARAYEGLRSCIGSHLVHYTLLQRYKSRCMWYDRDRLTSCLDDCETGKEDLLSRDLALYLFDNGISTLYRVQRGVHEYDLIGDQAKARIFVEVKVYDDNKARGRLIQGVGQLHAYINSLESSSPIPEIYYVVYRLDGPLYDLPLQISTNRHTFYPLVIDLGPSEKSGSRQEKPIHIPLDDFFAEL